MPCIDERDYQERLNEYFENGYKKACDDMQPVKISKPMIVSDGNIVLMKYVVIETKDGTKFNMEVGE